MRLRVKIKWYIKFKKAKVNKERWLPLPKEYKYVRNKRKVEGSEEKGTIRI